MLKLTPLVKTQGNRFYQVDWILQSFPKGYETLDYIEHYAGGGSVLLNKNLSEFEAINDIDLGIMQIHRALRDEPGVFIGRVKRVKYCESTFQRATKKHDFEDYMDHAVNEFVLRRMSVSGNRESFGGSEKTWNRVVSELSQTAKRLAHVHIFAKDARAIIQAFNDEKTFLYVDPPFLEENDPSANFHVELAELLGVFLGKVLISGRACALYRRLYQSWKCVKNPENKDVLWVNY